LRKSGETRAGIKIQQIQQQIQQWAVAGVVIVHSV
jgi:hypothetical protein